MEIRKAMQAKNISIEAVAGVMQVHRNTAANKVNGDTPFTIDEAFKIKALLFPEYDMEYLFAPDGGPTAERAS